jgi:hypothetical protein
MNLIALIGLLFDGTQVLVENIEMILILSVGIVGIGLLAFWGVTTGRAKGEHHHWVATLSLGLVGFVLLSYVIVAISRVWHASLAFLSNGLFLLSCLGCAIGFLGFLKKKSSPVDSLTSSSQSLS